MKSQPLTTERSLILAPLLLQPGQYLQDEQQRPWFPLYTEADACWYLPPGPAADSQRVHLVGIPLKLPTGPLLLHARGLALWPLLHALFHWPERRKDCQVLAELPESWPLPLKPSKIWWPLMPAGVIASLDRFDDWKIPARFCAERPGCFDGDLGELVARVMAEQPQLQPVAIQLA